LQGCLLYSGPHRTVPKVGNNAIGRGVGSGVKVEIWSDVVCPWCYIGKRRFEAALASFAHADQVTVVWRSFELDPDAAFIPGRPMVEQLASKYGRTLEQAAEMLAHMDTMAAGEGLEFNLAATTGGNTFAAHRLLHLGAAHGLQPELKEALLHAYFVERVPVADPDELRRVALAVGLPAGEVDDVLASDRYAAEVRADEAEASELGCSGVPFAVIDRAFAVPGAQDPQTWLSVLDGAWDRTHQALATVPAADGCDGDSCSL
jgi:predicted DsbA family dithiol-disulfide isomerase